MTRIKDLHKKWMKDAEYRREYAALEEEFALAAEVAKARSRAGLSQAELARRMKTTQSTIARLESGRGKPSTRTLGPLRQGTGHRVKISFEPVRGTADAVGGGPPCSSNPSTRSRRRRRWRFTSSRARPDRRDGFCLTLAGIAH